jgi:hypothetical protein
MASLKRKDGIVCREKIVCCAPAPWQDAQQTGETFRKGIPKPSSRDLGPADPQEHSLNVQDSVVLIC